MSMTNHENGGHDIFDDMYDIMGCEYISDMRFMQFAIFHELENIDFSQYSYENLNDFSNYVFGLDYEVLDQMIALMEARKLTA